MADEAKRARSERILASLALATAQINEVEKQLAELRMQRRKLVLLGQQDRTCSYPSMAKAMGISKPQVYKIVRNGYREPPLGEQPVSVEAGELASV